GAAAATARANRRVGLAATLLAVGMIGLAYAAVPLYRMFCQVTGFGGTTQVAAAAPVPTAVPGQMIKIRFDANVAPGLGWRFRPKATEVSIPIGEKRLAFYTSSNTAAVPVTGRAVFNVSPDVAGRYFIKIDCFCFTEQTLAAGETVDMPVSYYIDPAILDDPIARKVDEITLSYTFYPVDKPTPDTVSAATKRTTG
uniref:cytochrome c oxidase assembly protein n=1 Tax=Sandarakinorhabdus rubra TaxID=2672568 RepID=UPI0022A73358